MDNISIFSTVSPSGKIPAAANSPLEKFEERLEYFSFSNDEDPQEIAKRLFENAPKDPELQELVNLIFKKKAMTDDIPPIVNAILVTHPSFKLSGYNEIRLAIVADKKRTLTNSSFMEMIKKHELDKDEEKIAAFYDLAYRSLHPYICPLSQITIPTTDYTINFLWVNLNPQDRVKDIAENIFKDGCDLFENAECIKDPTALRGLEKMEKEQSGEKDALKNWTKIKESVAYRISKWADAQPNAQMNLWYDSALVTQKAYQNTHKMMEGIAESRGVNLKLRDIRQLSNIPGEIKYSLHPGTPVYYRVDILKALIGDYMISSPQESAKYCVVTDLDVEPMTPQLLFDQHTVNYLKLKEKIKIPNGITSNGYVFFNGGVLGSLENSFFIFNKENDDLRRIHRETIINTTAHTIEALRTEDPPIEHKYINSQFVYLLYWYFRRKMKEQERPPRKMVVCPRSQFAGGLFDPHDFKSEAFRFIGESNVPFTRNGRSLPPKTNDEDSSKTDEKQDPKEIQIEALKNWEAEPLG